MRLEVGCWAAGAGGEVDVDVVRDAGAEDGGEEARCECAGGDGLEEGELIQPSDGEVVLDFFAEGLWPPRRSC